MGISDLTILPDADSIIILDEQDDSRAATRKSIADELPSALIEAVRSVQDLRSTLERREFDIVVIDNAVHGPGSIELLHELRMREHEPTVLVVSGAADPHAIAEIYNHGCHRCIVKDGAWRPELGSIIRQTLRYRKIKDQNRDLHARLVEANMLLEEKNKRLDEFSATVAHDIRGPLSGLSMKLDFILENYKGKLEPRCEQLLESGMLSVGRLTAMVQGMYDYAKLGARAAHMDIVDLNDLVREVISDLHLDSRETKFNVGELPQVWGSEDLLRRLFINLFANAVKYNDSKVPAVKVEALCIKSQHLGDMCEICVEDNGRGIPAHEREFIFRMFQRGASSAHDQDGMGIGLAVVQRIVDLHFGKIRAEPGCDSGTRFIISLPLQRVVLAR